MRLFLMVVVSCFLFVNFTQNPALAGCTDSRLASSRIDELTDRLRGLSLGASGSATEFTVRPRLDCDFEDESPGVKAFRRPKVQIPMSTDLDSSDSSTSFFRAPRIEMPGMVRRRWPRGFEGHRDADLFLSSFEDAEQLATLVLLDSSDELAGARGFFRETCELSEWICAEMRDGKIMPAWRLLAKRFFRRYRSVDQVPLVQVLVPISRKPLDFDDFSMAILKNDHVQVEVVLVRPVERVENRKKFAKTVSAFKSLTPLQSNISVTVFASSARFETWLQRLIEVDE